MKDLETFCGVIRDYISLFDHLIEIEEKKIDAVTKEQITFVENCMNQEQAAILKLRGLEMQREETMKDLGCEGLSFREMTEKNPDFSASLLPLFQTLSARVQTFRTLSDSAKDLIETNLHIVNSILAESSAPAYGQNGSEQDSPKHFTSRSV